jgi:hypothetical protein
MSHPSTDTLPEVAFRPLEASDAPALLELNRACPMEAGLRFFFDRAPDFYRWPRTVFDAFRYVGAFEGAKLVGYAMEARYQGWTGRDWGPILYLGDVRVHPERRGARLAERIVRAIESSTRHRASDQEPRVGFFLIKEGNAPAERLAVTVSPSSYRTRRLCRVETISIPLLGRGRSRPVTRATHVRRAEPRDLPAVAAFLRRRYRGRLLAPHVTERRLGQWAAPPDAGVDPARHYLAESGGSLRGVLGLWDLGRMHRTVVLRYPFSALPLRIVYPVVRALRPTAPPLPRPGESLRALTSTDIAVVDDDPMVLRALVAAATADLAGLRYHVMHFAFAEGDALRAAFDGRLADRFGSAIHLLSTPGGPGDAASPLPPYVDPVGI